MNGMTMNYLQQAISLAPEYHVVPISPNQNIIIGDIDSFVLNGKMYDELFRGINGNAPIRETILRIGNIYSQQEFLCTIKKLIEKNILVLSEKTDTTSAMKRKDFSGETYVACHLENCEIIYLSRYIDRPLFTQCIPEISNNAFITFVLADDYLDPRLIEINNRFFAENRPWLLLKLCGKRPFIGPYFQPGKISRPCLHCLTDQLLYNQPVKKWLLRRGY